MIYYDIISSIGEMMKEIHFFTKCYEMHDWVDKHRDEGLDVESFSCFDQVEQFENDIWSHKRDDVICATLQMCFLRTTWFELGFRIFVHDNTGEFEIKLGQNDRTDREIRMGHNLYKLWYAGGFAP